MELVLGCTRVPASLWWIKFAVESHSCPPVTVGYDRLQPYELINGVGGWLGESYRISVVPSRFTAYKMFHTTFVMWCQDRGSFLLYMVYRDATVHPSHITVITPQQLTSTTSLSSHSQRYHRYTVTKCTHLYFISPLPWPRGNVVSFPPILFVFLWTWFWHLRKANSHWSVSTRNALVNVCSLPGWI